MQSTVPVQKGWLEALSDTMHLRYFMDKLHLSLLNPTEVAIYVGIGFFSAFLLKKWVDYLLAALTTLVILVALHHYGVILLIINWDRVYDVFGIRYTTGAFSSDALSIYFEWIKANSVIAASYLVGFLIGWKVS